jgi:catechol 2,3-dioxygenase-like lactoylglutathione lyase family enzyme
MDKVVEESMTGSAAELADQLVVEVMVRDLDRSLALYTALGFTLERRDGGFAALRWGERWLFLAQQAELPAPSGPTRANLRILVPDVDRLWTLAQALGLPVEQSIADRYYGLRDFTVIDPDGFGLRFASWLRSSIDP